MSEFIPEFPWEKTVNGLHAKNIPQRQVRPEIYARAMFFAFNKMKDVHHIGANFLGEKYFFEAQATTFLRQSTTAEFLGVYVPTVTRDEVQDEHIPYFCLRRAIWNLAYDKKRYVEARSKRSYIKGEEQIGAVSIFISYNAYPEIHALLSQLDHIAYQGFSFTDVERETPPWFEIDVRLVSELLSTRIEYCLHGRRCSALELWLTQWHTFFLKVDAKKSIVPEGDFSICYYPSLEEIDLFPE